MNGVHDSIPLELHPNAVNARAGKGQIELHLRRTVCDERMRVYHVYQVVAGGQHMSPGAKIFLQTIARHQVKTQLRVLSRNRLLEGLFPLTVPSGMSIKIVACLPHNETVPLLWLYEYTQSYRHPFLLRQPMRLPNGTLIRGLPADAKIVLIPGKNSKSSDRGVH